MATRKGGARAAHALRDLPQAFLERVLPTAGRKGGEVIAADARERLGDKRAESSAGKVLIADSVKVRVKRKETKIRVRIMLEGPGAYVGRWLEYGTDPHFISVDDSVSEGRTARRINNRIAKGDEQLKATLIINGKPVGKTVFHPGARKEPFLGPALHNREADAIAAMQAYVTRRASSAGIAGTDEPGEDG